MNEKPLAGFDEHGLLPPGIHSVSIAEVEIAFGKYQRSERRMRLFQRLADYLAELAKAEFHCQVIIDGSFVMSQVDEPEDIDLILVLPAAWDLTADLRPFEYNLIAKKSVKRQYGFDVYAVRQASPEYNQWVDFLCV